MTADEESTIPLGVLSDGQLIALIQALKDHDDEDKLNGIVLLLEKEIERRKTKGGCQ
jgi:hypothetical protein